jgi:hypothetical protein
MNTEREALPAAQAIGLAVYGGLPRPQSCAERHQVPQRTGDALPDGPKGILKKRSRWFVAHPENTAKVAAGDYPGLLGAMREIK